FDRSGRGASHERRFHFERSDQLRAPQHSGAASHAISANDLMDTQYRCQNEERRRLVGATEDAGGNPITPKLNGIDYLEVTPGDQKTRTVFFLHNLPGQPNPIPPAAPALTKANVVIEGGARVQGIKLDADPVAANNVLTVSVDQAGDYSTYTLRI